MSQDIIIVGSGISGLACAEYLHKSGNFNVTVLEAADIIGGRIKTLRWGPAKVEVGAAWVHGVGNNFLVKMAEEIGMGLGPGGEDCIFVQCSPESARDYLCIGPDGKDISKLVTEWQHAFSDFFDETLVNDSEEMQNKQINADCTVADALKKALDQSEFKKKWTAKLGEKLFNTLVGFSMENLEAFFAIRLEKLSLKWMEDFGEIREEDGESIVTGGYDTLIHAIAKKVPNIKTNTPVTDIIQNAQGKIKVVTTKGNFECDRVVVTVPLGILKARKINFQPPLPPRKVGAIDRLGFGVLGKVIMQFTDCFWPPNATWIEHISEEGFPAFIYNIYNRTKQPILVVHTSPSVNEKRRKENMTDEQLTKTYLNILEKHFGPQVHKKFVKSYVSDWDVYQWTLGSYSCLAYGASGDDYDIMAEPLLNQRLLFAGEATYRGHPATVDGAYLSGQREAKRIVATSPSHSKL